MGITACVHLALRWAVVLFFAFLFRGLIVLGMVAYGIKSVLEGFFGISETKQKRNVDGHAASLKERLLLQDSGLVVLVQRGFGLLVGSFIGAWACASVLAQIIQTKGECLKVKKRERPAFLDNPAFGEHKYIYLEDVKLHYVAGGEEGKPLMLFLHGFPEFWYSWRYQLKEFSRDFRVVAVDQRGYGVSGKPSGVENYTVDYLVDDVRRLINALGYRKCVLVGHDWGGVIAWMFASVYPDMLDKLVILNAPHPGCFPDYFYESWGQLKNSWYFFFFQLPYLPEFCCRMSDMKMLEECFLGKVSGVRSGKMSQEDVDAYKFTFSADGAFTYPINYYRGMTRVYLKPDTIKKISKPTLVVWGDQDYVLENELAPLAAKFNDNLTVKFIEGASHWVQMDQPEAVNLHIREFLDRAY